MKIDRKKFFDGFRKRIDSTISQEQVQGLEFLLKSFENDPQWKDPRHVAYALATIYHETAGSMQPVEEGYYLGNPSRVKAFQKSLRYSPYFGRGYVQLTWNTAKIPNYSKASKALGVDFVKNPNLVMVPKNAFAIMTRGMFEGWFTGKKLSNYINGTTTDYRNARKIINGLDKAGLIAGYAQNFEKILKESVTPSAQVSTFSLPTEAADFNESADESATPVPTDETEATDQPPISGEVVTQEAGVITNVGTGSTETEKRVEAADKLDTTEVKEKERTGFLGKISAIIGAIFTGTYAVPAFLTEGFNVVEFLKVVAGFLYEFRYWIGGALALWFVVNKWESVALRKKQIDMNTDPEKGQVVLTKHKGVIERVRDAIAMLRDKAEE